MVLSSLLGANLELSPFRTRLDTLSLMVGEAAVACDMMEAEKGGGGGRSVSLVRHNGVAPIPKHVARGSRRLQLSNICYLRSYLNSTVVLPK